jgi:hypothetical protein
LGGFQASSLRKAVKSHFMHPFFAGKKFFGAIFTKKSY